jgi:hypothetical protein
VSRRRVRRDRRRPRYPVQTTALRGARSSSLSIASRAGNRDNFTSATIGVYEAPELRANPALTRSRRILACARARPRRWRLARSSSLSIASRARWPRRPERGRQRDLLGPTGRRLGGGWPTSPISCRFLFSEFFLAIAVRGERWSSGVRGERSDHAAAGERSEVRGLSPTARSQPH